MDTEKRERTIRLVQAGTVAVYILLVLHSTVGQYIKLTKKNMEKEAKRRDKLNKAKYIKKKRGLKAKSRKKS